MAPIAINTLTSGSAAGGVTDGSGDGAFIDTVNTGHSAFYTALIDNVLYDTLIPFPIADSNPTVGGRPIFLPINDSAIRIFLPMTPTSRVLPS